MSSILIVEDEAGIASFLQKGLRAAGHTTVVVDDGNAAVAVARDDAFDLVLLDLGLPGRDGAEVLAAIRARGETMPVIVLTARAGLESTLDSLDGGADDYVTKPFRFEELLARVRARLRERGPSVEGGVLRVGTSTLDLRTRSVTVEDRTVDLTAREFALAEILFRHPGQVLSRQQLLDRVWGYNFDPGSNVVDVYVRYLRRKLGDGHIETLRGMGYRLRAP